ncbi:MAG: TetR/AcrR family transcriptional regulator [Pseudomonadota bacterium]
MSEEQASGQASDGTGEESSGQVLGAADDQNERSAGQVDDPQPDHQATPSAGSAGQVALLAPLYEVFVRQGYHGASLTDLARGCGRGKASLYHHFPGGKREMLDLLIRHSAERLETLAYGHLRRDADPPRRLRRFIDGFAAYTDGGRRNCLLGVLSATTPELLGDALGARQQEWRALLESTLRDAGAGKKSARHLARSVLARLYGSLALDRLEPEDESFRRTCKRLKKELADAFDGN